MAHRWIDITTDAEELIHTDSFWQSHKQKSDAGSFWADEIKHFRSDPGKRLDLAMENLPLPAAFREAAIALRQIIRRNMRHGDSIDTELKLLYWLATTRSFMVDYSVRLEEPGFNVIQSIPGRVFIDLPFDYINLGYRELALLNKTDQKWIVDAWGEPAHHTTLNRSRRELWNSYEVKLLVRRDQCRKKSASQWRAMISAVKTSTGAPHIRQRRWWKFW